MDCRSFWAGVITGLGLHGFRLIPEAAEREAGIHAPSDVGYERRDFLAGLAVGMNLLP